MDGDVAEFDVLAHKDRMTIHLVKLCVGAATVDALADWQAKNRRSCSPSGEPTIIHRTFQMPKRVDELLAGGSLYWVMKGAIAARQRLVAFTEGRRADGSNCCEIHLDPEIYLVRPVVRRAFQGWRYLKTDDAPPDLENNSADDIASMPPAMRKELAALCLL